MPEIRVMLESIRNVRISSHVVDVKDADAKIVTSVRFDYDGEPSEMENILLLEAQNRPINTEMYSPQAALPFGEDEKGED